LISLLGYTKKPFGPTRRVELAVSETLLVKCSRSSKVVQCRRATRIPTGVDFGPEEYEFSITAGGMGGTRVQYRERSLEVDRKAHRERLIESEAPHRSILFLELTKQTR
jgi:hypothetical protein